MSNNINTMQIRCYINYHWINTKIKSIQSKLFQCLFYTSKALNRGHLIKVLWKYLNNINTKGSPFCDVTFVQLLPYYIWPSQQNSCEFCKVITLYFFYFCSTRFINEIEFQENNMFQVIINLLLLVKPRFHYLWNCQKKLMLGSFHRGLNFHLGFQCNSQIENFHVSHLVRIGLKINP